VTSSFSFLSFRQGCSWRHWP